MTPKKIETLEVVFYPSYDHRDEPNDNKGCCSARMILVYRGKKGVITCNIFTDWMSNPLTVPYRRGQPTPRPRSDKPGIDAGHFGLTIGPVESHSKIKRNSWETAQKGCGFLEIDSCYGDVGFSAGDEVFTALVAEGTEGAIREMKSIHDAWFRKQPK